MLKVLLKLQLTKFFASFTISPKTGKRRKPGAIVAYALIYLYVAAIFVFQSTMIANGFCALFVEAGADWYYFLFMGLMSFCFSTLLSALASYGSLYQSKDNELLLSMPVKPSAVLISRMFGSVLFSLAFVAVFLIPSYVVYEINTGFSFDISLICLLMVVLITILSSSVAGILGFLMAQITARMKKNNAGITILALMFGFGYAAGSTYIQNQMQLAVEKVVLEGSSNQSSILIMLGSAFLGNGKGSVIFLLATAVLGFAVYELLSRSFLKLITFKKGFKKNKYKESMVQAKSFKRALLRNEFTHLGHSAIYLLNVSLGTLMCTIGGIVLLVLSWKFMPALDILVEFKQYFAVAVAVIAVFAASMNTVTSCIIAVEGKQLWIKKTMPVKTESILFAKLDVHCILTCIPAMFLTLAMSIITRLNVAEALICIAISCLYGCLTGIVGLIIELKLPKLTFQSDAYAVKQNTNVLIAIGLDVAVVAVMGGLYVLLRNFVNPTVYLAFVDLILLLVAVLLIKWLKTKGVKLFEEL